METASPKKNRINIRAFKSATAQSFHERAVADLSHSDQL